jgi:dolichol-phosphate mannosyltransferase
MSQYSIIIPTLNEKKNIPILINKINKFIKNKNYEIIVVDDNSNDGSPPVLYDIKKKYKKFSFYIRKAKMRDLSKSIIFGVQKSKFNNLIVMDGDLQHNPKYLPILIKKFNTEKQDVLVAVRNFKKRSGLSFFRFFMSLSLIKLINLIFEKKTSDPMSGFFVIKKKLFFLKKKKLYANGFKILFDLVYNDHNIVVTDHLIKFDLRRNNKSKMNLKVIYHIIRSIIKKIAFRLT